MPKRSSISPENDGSPAIHGAWQLFAGERASPPKPPSKNPAAVALGRLGGLKGGKARAARLTPERRSEIAAHAARKRWDKAKSKVNWVKIDPTPEDGIFHG